MITQRLIDTAQALFADDKGLLAMDESNSTCNQRFRSVGDCAEPPSFDQPRAYLALSENSRFLRMTQEMPNLLTGPTGPRRLFFDVGLDSFPF